MIQRVVVGISGASGAAIGLRILERLANLDDVETHLVVSGAAEKTLRHEVGSSRPRAGVGAGRCSPRQRRRRGQHRQRLVPNFGHDRRPMLDANAVGDRREPLRQLDGTGRRCPPQGAAPSRFADPREPAAYRPPAVNAAGHGDGRNRCTACAGLLSIARVGGGYSRRHCSQGHRSPRGAWRTACADLVWATIVSP
jgi:hypothetical protein